MKLFNVSLYFYMNLILYITTKRAFVTKLSQWKEIVNNLLIIRFHVGGGRGGVVMECITNLIRSIDRCGKLLYQTETTLQLYKEITKGLLIWKCVIDEKRKKRKGRTLHWIETNPTIMSLLKRLWNLWVYSLQSVIRIYIW